MYSELGAWNQDQAMTLNGQDAIGIQIYLAPGANAVGTAEAVAQTMRGLAARFPEGIEYAVTYDTTGFVKLTIEVVIHTLIEAFVLVFIVVLVLLKTSIGQSNFAPRRLTSSVFAFSAEITVFVFLSRV